MKKHILQLPVHYYWWTRAQQKVEDCDMASHGVAEHQNSFEPHDSPFAWALDLTGPEGVVALLAPDRGTIRAARKDGERWTENSGNYTDIVIPTAAGDVIITFSHMAGAPEVKPGQKVEMGTRLGYIGRTGKTYAPHVHIEAMWWPSQERLCPYRIFTNGIPA